jgi:NTP pyrophosphatase (non-canonical NTP hydrolase)
MELQQLTDQAIRIKELYGEKNRTEGLRQWGATEYAQGFVADVGDLLKLMMARDQFRSGDHVEQRIRHELVDCLWSVLVIAHELNIDLAEEFAEGMKTLESRIVTG